MVLRASDTPTTVAGRLNATDDRVDDVVRTQARGTRSLQNDAGHKLDLNPGAQNPLLNATGGNDAIDSALGFSSGTLQVVSQTGEQFRDIEASGLILHDSVTVPSVNVGDGGITTTGDVSAGGVDATRISSTGIVRGSTGQFDGNVNAAGASLGSNGIFTAGPANVGPIGTSSVVATGGVTGGFANINQFLNAGGVSLSGQSIYAPGFANLGTIGTSAAAVSNNIHTNSLTATGDVNVLGTALSAIINWWNSTFSSSDLKEGFGQVDDADADALLAAPVKRWTFAPRWVEQPRPPGAEGPCNLVDRRADDRPHYGPVAEDLPEMLRYTSGDEEHFRVDLMSFQGLLLHICQRQQRQIKGLAAQVDQLEDRLAAAGI